MLLIYEGEIMDLLRDRGGMRYFFSVGQIVYYDIGRGVEYGRIDNASYSAVYVNGRIITYECILTVQEFR